MRTIGRWSLVALMVNSVIGSSIFGLPSTLVSLLRNLSPVAVMLAGGLMLMIVGCYAEVASQFSDSGGPYLYARVAFGRLTGIQMGWMLWLAQVAATAANANLFVIYLAEFWPQSHEPFVRGVILTLLVGSITEINRRGVRAGTTTSNIFTVAKLVPLLLIIFAGAMFMISGHSTVTQIASNPAPHPWLKSLLLLVFFYGGFETALAPSGETENPQREVVFALFAALFVCALIYALIQWVVIAVLPNAALSSRPLADVAQLTMGKSGVFVVTAGALIALYGYLSAKVLSVPRVIYALAEHNDSPQGLASVHPKYHTPSIAILVFATLMWVLAVAGSFEWNVTLSAVARLFYYAVGCAALPVLRKKQPSAARFRLPGGPLIALLGVTSCVVLGSQIESGGWLILLITIMAAFVNWFLVHQTRSTTASSVC